MPQNDGLIYPKMEWNIEELSTNLHLNYVIKSHWLRSNGISMNEIYINIEIDTHENESAQKPK